jgi:hypothetical protein
MEVEAEENFLTIKAVWTNERGQTVTDILWPPGGVQAEAVERGLHFLEALQIKQSYYQSEIIWPKPIAEGEEDQQEEQQPQQQQQQQQAGVGPVQEQRRQRQQQQQQRRKQLRQNQAVPATGAAAPATAAAAGTLPGTS